MGLPHDIARCNNTACKLKENCLRWLDKEGTMFWYSDFEPKEDVCEFQIKHNLN